MEFAEWLQFDEARFKGLQRQFKSEHPDMPDYVQKDIYNNRISYAFGKQMKDQSLMPTAKPAETASNPSNIFKMAGFKDLQWIGPAPLNGRDGRPGVTPADFSTRTLELFEYRRFGFRAEPRIRADAERMSKQYQLMQQRSEQNEPTIVKQTNRGYELLEGWHRTMNYLLRGAPPEHVKILQTPNAKLLDLDYSQWQKVQIRAYVGQGKDIASALAGTGDYTR